MGVSEYRLSAALPEPLRRELPTVAEFAREFPLMSLVKLRIEFERELRAIVKDGGLTERPLSIGATLAELAQTGSAPPSTARFQAAQETLNQAAHGFEIPEDAAAEAAEIAAAFLAELREIRSGSVN